MEDKGTPFKGKKKSDDSYEIFLRDALNKSVSPLQNLVTPLAFRVR